MHIYICVSIHIHVHIHTYSLSLCLWLFRRIAHDAATGEVFRQIHAPFRASQELGKAWCRVPDSGCRSYRLPGLLSNQGEKKYKLVFHNGSFKKKVYPKP